MLPYVPFLLATLLAALGAVITADDAWLVGEDMLLEMLAALLFLAAALVAAWRLRPGQPRHSGWLWLIAPLGLACSLSEVSFGARLFGWKMPAMPGGGEFDGVHDTAMLALRAWRSWAAAAPGIAWAAVAFGLAGVLGVAWWLRAWLRAQLVAALGAPIGQRMLVTLGLLACALVLDLELFRFRHQRHVEEWAETAAAFWMLVASLAGCKPAAAALPPLVTVPGALHGR